jgi:RNA polymerase sigma-70 factor (ECF subfamily)
MLTFHDLYQKYAHEVYRFAFWLSGSAMEADDITAETFTRAWTSRRKIRTATVKAYLFTIARNLYLEQLRQEKRLVHLEPNHADPRARPEKTAEHRFQLQNIRKLVQSLPEVDRTVFLLRVQHDLPYAEIAHMMEISVSAAKVKVHRVRLRLAEMQVNEDGEQ